MIFRLDTHIDRTISSIRRGCCGCCRCHHCATRVQRNRRAVPNTRITDMVNKSSAAPQARASRSAKSNEIDDIFGASSTSDKRTERGTANPADSARKKRKCSPTTTSTTHTNKNKPQPRKHIELVTDQSTSTPSTRSKKLKTTSELSQFTDSRGSSSTRKRTEEGYKIYTAQELGLSNNGGDTIHCPFDCQCCTYPPPFVSLSLSMITAVITDTPPAPSQLLQQASDLPSALALRTPSSTTSPALTNRQSHIPHYPAPCHARLGTATFDLGTLDLGTRDLERARNSAMPASIA